MTNKCSKLNQLFLVALSPNAVQQALTLAAAAHTLLNTSQQSVNPISGASSSSLNSGMASSPGIFYYTFVRFFFV